MTEPRQRTLAGAVTLEGPGVHSGRAAVLTFRPAETDTGIRFKRTDLADAPEIPATLDHVVETELGTSLGVGSTTVLTVEHVLAALAGAGADNAVLELSGPEPPIRDGSFQDFVQAVASVGLVEQDAPARVIEVKEPLTVDCKSGASYVAVPADGFRISATIQFAHPVIGRQYGSFEITPESFERDLAPARTFGFRADAEALLARGLALGASLDNTVVLDEESVLNEGLRFPDEFLRHKAGDVVGDLALLGARIRGHVVAERPSHQGNVALARAIAEQGSRTQAQPILDATKILRYLPHRYPMLLVDRIIEFEAGVRIVGIKNVSINEPFFQGHYPDHPVMPGVLQIEAMAQVGGLLLLEGDETKGKLVYFMTLDNVKWRRPVTPGDQIVFEVEVVQLRRGTCRLRGTGKVDGHLVVEADMMARIVGPMSEVQVDAREWDEVRVHETALVDSGAELGPGVEVGPFSIVGPGITVGAGTTIGPHVLLERDTTVGRDCQISYGAVLGTDPQDLKFQGEETVLEVGDRTVIREYATLNRGTAASGRTVVGSDCLLMAYTHVAHDCEIGNHVILSNAVNMAGHVVIEDWVIVGGLSPIHQFVRIGAHAFVGGASRLAQDVPPYVRVAGSPPKLYGLNSVGLDRRGLSEEVRRALKSAYRILFQSGLNVTQGLARAEAEVEQLPEVRHLLTFIRSSERGITVT